MFEDIYTVLVYLIMFIASLYALSALDFNRFVKQGSVAKSQLLYIIIAFSLAYLSGSLVLKITGH